MCGSPFILSTGMGRTLAYSCQFLPILCLILSGRCQRDCLRQFSNQVKRNLPSIAITPRRYLQKLPNDYPFELHNLPDHLPNPCK